eukprot:1252577-Rhodomonas_salina.5
MGDDDAARGSVAARELLSQSDSLRERHHARVDDVLSRQYQEATESNGGASGTEQPVPVAGAGCVVGARDQLRALRSEEVRQQRSSGTAGVGEYCGW